MNEPHDSTSESSSAKFGLTTLTCVVIASMIGAGVFTTSGFALADLGSPVRVLIAWAIGGVIAICGAIAYGELARRLPGSGGEYHYLSKQLHPFVGFLAGWVSLTAGFSGAIAMAAMTFEAYVVPIFETYVFADHVRPGWLKENSVAVVAILTFGVGHAFLIKPFASVQNAIVGIKLFALAVFLVVAATKVPTHAWHLWDSPEDLAPFWSTSSIVALAGSIMWISLSYAGFNAAVYIASEVRNPETNVPRSLWLGTGLVTVLYVLLNLVFVCSNPPQDVAGQKEIAAISAKSLGGDSLELLIRVAIGLGTLSSVAGMIMTGPRVFSRMADDGMFPSWFRTGRNSVHRTVLLQSAIATTLVLSSSLRQLLSYLSTTLAISSAVTVLTLLLPKGKTHPSAESGNAHAANRLPMLICLSAWFYVAMTFLTALLLVRHAPRDLLGTAVIFVAGGLVWLATGRHRMAR